MKALLKTRPLADADNKKTKTLPQTKKPEPRGLSRAEVRQLVIEMIG